MGRGWRLAVTISLLLLCDVALAEPAVNVGFVPISTMRTDGEQTVVVERGDHLWRISQDHLDTRLGRKATVEEVDPYWRRLIVVNRDHLRSGDPDLIYPGEVISLPATG